jgi:hypothetical protein
LFPTSNRAQAYALIAVVAKFFVVFVPFLVQVLIQIQPKFPFLILVPADLLALILVYFFVNETKENNVDYINPII